MFIRKDDTENLRVRIWTFLGWYYPYLKIEYGSESILAACCGKSSIKKAGSSWDAQAVGNLQRGV
jgi:hypothetical protein